MPMPRVISGTAPSAGVLNTWAAEIDALGAGCKVRRLDGFLSVADSTDTVIPWTAVSYDTVGNMFNSANPTFVTCRLAGVYAITLQERFAASGGGTGQRAGKILVNGTSVFTNSQASDKRAASTTAEGVTCSMTAIVRLSVDDLVFANLWHNAGATINVAQTDYGGTYMSVNRMGPLVG